MCGRYTLFTPPETLEDRFGATFDAPFTPSYNCAPGQSLHVITDEEPERFRRFEWGLTPSWADEEFGLINARAETLREKRSFAEAFERRRCLVPADGFYEWVEEGGDKRPYRIAFEDDRPFAMAGLYERWRPPTTQTGLDRFGGGTSEETDEVVESFTVVTTEPNDLVADLHHRMAVILDPADEGTWLHGSPDEAASLLDPFPGDALTAYPVSTHVNSPANDGAELIERVDDASGPASDSA